MNRRPREGRTIRHAPRGDAQLGFGTPTTEGLVRFEYRWSELKHGERERHEICDQILQEDAITIAACIVKAIPDGRALLDRTLADFESSWASEQAEGQGPAEPKGA